ncbi:MAG: FAD-dependent oxidoreductase [Ilumatobacteraceae bacterium]|nr:FAD-dependent oxidoreductase [Ilumatobacteraceae bacterium]
MAHTPLLTMLQRAASDIAADDVGEERRVETDAPDGTSRRRFLAGAAAAGAVAAAWRIGDAAPVAAAAGPRIVIVGGGLAGLTCAYQLRKAGYLAEIHEASPDRVGGRCWSIHDYFAEGQVAEHGGELIDQGHTEVRQLAQSLGLPLENLLAAEQNGTEPKFWFDNGPYTYTQATSDLKGIWQKIKSDVQAASYPTLYNLSTARGRQLDQMSIIDWINESVPGGITSKLGQLLDVAYNIEYGAECSVQSSLNLLYLLGFSGQGQLRIFGTSNEKYHVRGGNDQIVAGLRSLLTGQITFGSALTALTRRADGAYDITMRFNGKNVTSRADRVVLALPFAVLRTLDISKAGFSPVKLRAIRELGMGTNSKLNVQFTERLWRKLGVNGDTFADTGYQSTWEVTRAQPGVAGILVDYTGGAIGASFGTGTPTSRAQQFTSQIEPLLPGLWSRFNGRATIDFWTANPYTNGSYSYWKVGQYTGFAGAEREQSGNCHFAGEHTSIDFQGYLNGAVETGYRAAGEILAGFK